MTTSYHFKGDSLYLIPPYSPLLILLCSLLCAFPHLLGKPYLLSLSFYRSLCARGRTDLGQDPKLLCLLQFEISQICRMSAFHKSLFFREHMVTSTFVVRDYWLRPNYNILFSFYSESILLPRNKLNISSLPNSWRIFATSMHLYSVSYTHLTLPTKRIV